MQRHPITITHVASLLYFLVQLLVARPASGIAEQELFTFGPGVSDAALFPNDDDSSPMLCLSVGFPYFDTTRHCLFVNNNGVITFTEGISQYTSDSFPLVNNFKLIAPYWADVDTRQDGGGNVYYRESGDPSLLSKANDYVHNAFITHRNFRSSLLFIATWDHVAYYMNRNNDNTKLNTFQCVLVTDGQDLFVIFLYSDIQWTTGDASGGANGLGGTPAQVGFNAGDMQNFFSVPGSQSPDIININQTSNIGVPGVWLFHASPSVIASGGCTENGANLQIDIFPSYGNILGGDSISVQGPCFDVASNILEITCEVDSVETLAVLVSRVEAVCVSPRLTRVGRVPFKLYVNGILQGETVFTSLDVENAHQVDLTLPGNILTFTSGSTAQIQWNPNTIFPNVDSSLYSVDIVLNELDPASNQWNERALLLGNTPNDGEETIRITDPPVSAVDLSPIAIQVSVNVMSLNTSQTNAQYLRLVSRLRVGRWTSQFYYIQPIVAMRVSRQLCGAWFSAESSEIGRALTEASVACPPRRDQAVLPNSGLNEVQLSSFFGNTMYQTQWLGYFHPRASSCFRQRTANISQALAVEQECCYGSNGNLINGPPGGGSVNKLSQRVSRGGHYIEDIRPYILCCTGRVPSCQSHFQRRPSDNGSRYDPPPPAWMFGDPHLVTLDGHRYTFNGHGEFVLIETTDNSFTLQGRMIAYNTSSPSSGTLFSAIVAREEGSSTVMIAQTRRGIDAYVDGSIINLEFINEQDFDSVTILRRDSATISATFSSGAYIEAKVENDFLSRVVVSLPEGYSDKTRGLLGVFNGDPTDDLRSKTGDVLQLGIGNEDLHNQFGTTWMLTDESASLFTYLPYQSFSSFQDPTFVPVFDPDYSTVTIPNHLTVCAGDMMCLYDVTVTGNVEIAGSTHSSVLEVTQIEQLSVPVTCSPPCLNGACVAENVCSCGEGYIGATCDQPVYSECSTNPCQKNEKCGVLAGSYYCEANCNESGNPVCGLPATGPCSSNLCLNGGVCSPNSSLSLSFACLCLPEYSGILCGIGGTAPPCPCQNGGRCVVDSSDPTLYTCSCPTAYSGELCTQAATDATDNTLIIVIACVCLCVVLVVLIGIAVICVSCICRACRRTKHGPSQGDIIDSHTRIKSSSTLLHSPRPATTMDTSGLVETEISPARAYSDQNFDVKNGGRRLSYQRTPVQSQEALQSHTIIQTSPSPPGAVSSSSLNVQPSYYNRTGQFKHNKLESTTSLMNGTSSSSSGYMNYPQQKELRPKSQQGYHDYLGTGNGGTWYQSSSSVDGRSSQSLQLPSNHGPYAHRHSLSTVPIIEQTHGSSTDSFRATDV